MEPSAHEFQVSPPLREFRVEQAAVRVYSSKLKASRAAALEGASILRSTLTERDCARIMVATGNSQQEMIEALAGLPDIAWNRVDVFHMDEYVGLRATHPASFRLWVEMRLVGLVHPHRVYYLNGYASDLTEECRRYGELLRREPADICFLGIGENGHVAFNDPHVADFRDPLAIKRVDLDERCRRQQVGEDHFPDLNAVPREALKLTCPTLMRSRHLVCCVPEARKAEAVRNALEGPISTACPGSIVRTHPRAAIFLDLESAALLS